MFLSFTLLTGIYLLVSFVVESLAAYRAEFGMISVSSLLAVISMHASLQTIPTSYIQMTKKKMNEISNPVFITLICGAIVLLFTVMMAYDGITYRAQTDDDDNHRLNKQMTLIIIGIPYALLSVLVVFSMVMTNKVVKYARNLMAFQTNDDVHVLYVDNSR